MTTAITVTTETAGTKADIQLDQDLGLDLEPASGVPARTPRRYRGRRRRSEYTQRVGTVVVVRLTDWVIDGVIWGCALMVAFGLSGLAAAIIDTLRFGLEKR